VLRDLQYKAVYRSEDDNLLADFYLPALNQAVSYDRAVGYFSSAMLSYAAQGIAALIEKQGTMRLIVGSELTAEENDAILNGYDLRHIQERVGRDISKTIEQVIEELSFSRLQALSWMIAKGSLSMKVALKRRGMYHEKIGIFRDGNGDQVVFQGSANETVNALIPDFNFESINVFPMWREELVPHGEPYVKGFARLWDNQAKDTMVLDFPEAARNKLLQIAKKITIAPSSKIELAIWDSLNAGRLPVAPEAVPKFPLVMNGQKFEIKEHQRKALRSWLSQTFRGVLALATGAGKTITALYAATKVFENRKRLFVIIAVPYRDLADQWVDEAAMFNMHAIPCYDKLDNWKETLGEATHLFNVGSLPFVCVVVVNRTLLSDEFQAVIRTVDGVHMMFVGDECHRHRSPRIIENLPVTAAYRLGLSATPERQFGGDDGSIDPLFAYYGDVCATYTLRQALDDEILTPYDYHPIIVELNGAEAEEYIELSAEISRRSAMAGLSDDGSSDDSGLEMLLFKRSRIIGAASNKLPALQLLLTGAEPSPLTLVYCGDGNVESPDDGDTLRQIEATSILLGNLGWKSSRFTSRENKRTRKDLLEDFKIGNIDALVAIRCLDEGINIPGCHTAYLLASSRSPRQFIQRRGRILRRAPGKERATIYDFIVTLPESVATLDHERKLFGAELLRVAEFAGLAKNYASTYRKLEPLLQKYNLVHAYH
jgi:superfamily II DNA or RNA helicase